MMLFAYLIRLLPLQQACLCVGSAAPCDHTEPAAGPAASLFACNTQGHSSGSTVCQAAVAVLLLLQHARSATGA
jgi:hypothetical protein